jgi:hypothetical protein
MFTGGSDWFFVGDHQEQHAAYLISSPSVYLQLIYVVPVICFT